LDPNDLYKFPSSSTGLPLLISRVERVLAITSGAFIDHKKYRLPAPPENQLKKADFYLLQSDKRLAASILLVEKGNEELAENTSSKGLDYLEKTIAQINEAKESQLSVDDIILQLNSSAAKHREEISKLKDQTSGEIAKKFEGQYQRAKQLEKIAEELAP